MAKINDKLDVIYSYIVSYVETNGIPPTVRDICRDLNVKSTASAKYYVDKLIERGLITKLNDKKRSITLTNKQSYLSVPLIGNVTAGSPILAVENFDGYYPIPNEFKSDSELFMLKVFGDSMINAGIYDGDKIIVKKQETCDNGDIVVALLDDLTTVKRFYKKDNVYVLHPENDTMQDILLDKVEILGVVVGLIRKF